MGDGTPVDSRRLPVTKDEDTPPPSWNSTLGGFHQVMNALMALLIGLKYATGMETLITLVVVALVFHFGLMYAAKKLPAYYPDVRDFAPFIDKISNFFGMLALIFELLIIVIAYGSVPLFLWSICMASAAVAVVVLVRLAFVELKEKLREYWKRVYDGITVSAQSALELTMSMTELISVMGSNTVTTLRGAFDQLKELFRSRSQNQIINALSV